MNTLRRFAWLAALLVVLLVAGCSTKPAEIAVQAPAPAAPKAIDLTILHVNDTHSKLEPISTALRVDIDETLKGKLVYVELGGFPRVWAALDRLRESRPAALFLHAGDAFQGTLYFTQYLGAADVDFLNAMRVDAMVLGNHEFDKGPAVLKIGLLDTARFPVLSANTLYGQEPVLQGAPILPYTVKTVEGERVGIIGLTLADTPFISSPGKNITFDDPAAVAARAVRELSRQGVNKIVVLSHLGYEADVELARATEGVDVIVGGHTHTLLGDMAQLGLAARGPYPTVVTNAARETVLVVQAWEWAKVVGDLSVSFDPEGRVRSWKGTPRLIVGDSWFRIYDLPGAEGKPVRVEFTRTPSGFRALESDGRAYTVQPPAQRAAAHLAVLQALASRFALDPRLMVVADKPEGASKLAPYAAGVAALKSKVACEAAEELRRGNNRGPGPIIADAMLWKTGCDVAIMNPGGVRTNLNPGPVSVAQVYELQPFGNTLVTLPLSGAELSRAIEDMCDFTITSYSDKTAETALIYVSGVTFQLDARAKKGSRVSALQVGRPGAYAPLDAAKTYKLVVNSFMAAGGDKNTTLKELATRQYDTGYIDSEATLEYLQGKTLRNEAEQRVLQKL